MANLLDKYHDQIHIDKVKQLVGVCILKVFNLVIEVLIRLILIHPWLFVCEKGNPNVITKLGTFSSETYFI